MRVQFSGQIHQTFPVQVKILRNNTLARCSSPGYIYPMYITKTARHSLLYRLALRIARRRKLHLMNELLLIALRENTDKLIDVIHRFDYDSFNRQPGEGKWSAGDISEHLLLFDLRMNKILKGATIPAGRDPQQYVSVFQPVLQDRVSTITAPPILIPTEAEKDPALIADQIIAEREKIMKYVEENDMNLLFHETKHRAYGEMTGVEWIQFMVMHTERHLAQFNELLPQ